MATNLMLPFGGKKGMSQGGGVRIGVRLPLTNAGVGPDQPMFSTQGVTRPADAPSQYINCTVAAASPFSFSPPINSTPSSS